MKLTSWRRGTLVLTLAALAIPQSAAASPVPPRAKEVVLTTGLRVEWTGVKGVRLRIPRTARLPHYAARFTLRGGTYASVRMSRLITCSDGTQCGGISMEMDFSRVLAERVLHEYPAGQRHFGYATNGGGVPPGVWDLYLFTDGHATIEFDETGLDRRARAYTAAGRIRGSFQRLREFCGTAYCTPGSGYAGRIRTGGVVGDVGRYGLVDGWAVHYRPTYDDTPQGLHIRACAYPQAPDETGKPAVDHPLGCDDEAERGTADVWMSNFVFSGLPPYYSAVGRGMGKTDARGRVYLGFQAGREHDLVDTEVEAWGVWFEYGVH